MTPTADRSTAGSASKSLRQGHRALLVRTLGVLGLLLVTSMVTLTAHAAEPASAPGWSQSDLTKDDAARAGDAAQASMRLWARFTHVGAHLTLDPAPVRPSARAEGNGAGADTAPVPLIEGITTSSGQLTLGVFDRVEVGPEGVYVQPAQAAWHTRLRSDVPVEASWRLSVDATPPPGTDMRLGSGSASRTLNVETRLVAWTPDGDSRTLSTGVSQVTMRASGIGSDRAGAPTDVTVRLPVVTGAVHEGERLVVQLRWSWASLTEGERLAPPLVTVHHGSWFRFGVDEPLRVLDFQERTVLGGLYVKMRLAHLFSSDAIDLERLGLRLRGAGLAMAAPQRLVETEEAADGAFAPHAFRTDWRVPIEVATFGSQEMHLRLLARQVGDDGPRLLATRAFSLSPDEASEARDGAAGPDGTLAGAMVMAAAPLALLFHARRRRRQDHHVARLP